MAKPQHERRAARVYAWSGRWAAFFALAVACGAQSRTVAIQDATLYCGAGEPLAQGSVLFSEGKITAAGPGVSAPFFARKIAARGKFVTPGLIDVYSTVGLRAAGPPGVSTARAADAFDRYADDELRGAWRDGVTLWRLPARSASGVSGYGAIVRPGAEEPVVRPEAGLCLSFGTGSPGPVARVKAFEELRRRFQAARDYRTAWEDYQENVKEYEEKLAKQNAATSKPTEEPAPPSAGKGASRNPSPAEPKKDDKPAKREAKDGKEAKDGRDAKDGKDGKKDEELKKPPEPAKDRALEALLRALDGEVRVHIEAHEPADILNALDLAREFNLAIVLEGASGAHRVAAELAQAGAPVVLTGLAAPTVYLPGAGRWAAVDAAAKLQAAGAQVYVGSGVAANPESGPQLTLRLARLLGGGWQADDPLALVTTRAAELLGIEKDYGRLAEGQAADLVVWSAAPLTPGARVERVFVEGREVYRADDVEKEAAP